MWRTPPAAAVGPGRVHGPPPLGPAPGVSQPLPPRSPQPAAHDVVVVDETSMMSLPLMARLVEAVRRDARLVLLGTSNSWRRWKPERCWVTSSAPRERPAGARPGPAPELASALPCCRPTIASVAHWRSWPTRCELATQTRWWPYFHRLRSQDRVAEELVPGDDTAVDWLAADVATAGEVTLAPVRELVLAAGQPLIEAARRGDGPGALDALGRCACCVPTGTARPAPARGTPGPNSGCWRARARRPVVAPGTWPPRHRYRERLQPGLVQRRRRGCGRRAGREPGCRLQARGGRRNCQPVPGAGRRDGFAMTAHRAQGFGVRRGRVLLPSASSRALTRELLYTAVTRARQRVVLVGTEESVRAAVRRRVRGPRPDRPTVGLSRSGPDYPAWVANSGAVPHR